MQIEPLRACDVGYCLASWREGHKQSPDGDRIPWSFYKVKFGKAFSSILDNPDTVLLGAYRGDELLGFLVMSPGRRVDTLHWIQTRFKDSAGAPVRRQGVMTALVDAARLGERCIYTLRGQRRAGGSFDETIAAWLRGHGTAAAYEPLLSWIK